VRKTNLHIYQTPPHRQDIIDNTSTDGRQDELTPREGNRYSAGTEIPCTWCDLQARNCAHDNLPLLPVLK